MSHPSTLLLGPYFTCTSLFSPVNPINRFLFTLHSDFVKSFLKNKGLCPCTSLYEHRFPGHNTAGKISPAVVMKSLLFARKIAFAPTQVD